MASKETQRRYFLFFFLVCNSDQKLRKQLSCFLQNILRNVVRNDVFTRRICGKIGIHLEGESGFVHCGEITVKYRIFRVTSNNAFLIIIPESKRNTRILRDVPLFFRTDNFDQKIIPDMFPYDLTGNIFRREIDFCI